MRIYDQILVRESDLNLTNIDDIDLILLPQHQANQLLKEYIIEHELSPDSVDLEDLKLYLGNNIVITDDENIDNFKFYKEIK